MTEGASCSIEKCKRPYRAKGYCNVHYKKWRHGEYGKKRYKTCKAEGCLKPVHAGSVCDDHYGVKIPKPHHEAHPPAAAATEGAPVPEKETKEAAPEGAPEEKKEAKAEKAEKKEEKHPEAEEKKEKKSKEE